MSYLYDADDVITLDITAVGYSLKCGWFEPSECTIQPDGSVLVVWNMHTRRICIDKNAAKQFVAECTNQQMDRMQNVLI
jgi:hypothetical protein